jgi:gamma-glutamylcyclotransferase (GGCT)/AIG2-like uncharacterized protein YtfP
MHHVFVYGSLKQGFHNHPVLGDSRLVCEAVIFGFKMVNAGSYPALLPRSQGQPMILGEVYEVDDDTLSRLDRLECVPHLYTQERSKVHPVSFPNGVLEVSKNTDRIDCIVYIGADKHFENCKLVESGDVPYTEWKG